ncbi:HipA domain-containing protein [Legionella spiritensis]|uniref:HipA protein, DNA binding regulator n=1 Tax=Legionella spiritensis TaxID=452 RepID=A0A0W0YWI1_LEGSP|nr:HipA domain-containing protein [Legionella spiritensis]KTD61195.1 HipA protein, DNA binding regulator [Legionella spiritensis]SNV28367.1 HipA protein [Legionella spiritensis]
MIGSEHVLDVYLGDNIIAELSLVNDQLHWHYRPDWQQNGYPVSPHLPLDREIPPLNVTRFLRNLLPEGNALEELINTFHLSKGNTFGLVRALGLDTPGSLVFRSPTQSSPIKTSFRPVLDKELEQRLDSRDEFSLIIWDGKPRLSVAGVQDKINVVLNEENQLGFGEGNLCSTHILKFEKQKLAHLVLNEYVTMRLARLCGLNVANAKLLCYGKNPALLVERFDRHFISLTEVKRRHMIDGCQALNVPPDYKYERNFGSGRDVAHIRDGVSLEKLFEFANQCENPALAKQRMLDWVLFNTLIFNCDAHGKNISFFVGSKGLSLTPFYDLVNIKMYPEFEHDLAMALGDEFDENNVNAYQLADFADTCQLPRSFVTNRLKYLGKKLSASVGECHSAGINDDERAYLHHYKKMIQERCNHLLKEADGIVSMEL